MIKMKYRFLLIMLAISVFFACGCQKKEDETKEEQLISKLTEEFEVGKKDNYDKVVALLVDETPVYLDEVMWNIYLLEESMKVYEENYEGDYWAQDLEGTGTLAQVYTKNLIEQIIDNTFIAELAVKEGLSCDRDALKKEGEEILKKISKEDKEKYGLTIEAYVSMSEKWELKDLYVAFCGKEADISKEELKKDHPYESFEGKINTKYLMFHNTYVDENGEKKVHDNATIDKGVKELEAARQELLSGKSMEEAAKNHTMISMYEGSFYKDLEGVQKSFKTIAINLKEGEISEVFADGMGAYVVERKKDTKQEDYETYLSELEENKRLEYGNSIYSELTEKIEYKANEKVWSVIEVGKIK